MDDARIRKLAQVLVRYSTAVQPGNVVSLTGPPGAETLIVALYREVLRAGGHPVVFMVPQACREMLLCHGNARQLAFVDQLDPWEVERADVCIHLVTEDTVGGLSGVDLDRRFIHQHARRPLLERFWNRVARKSLRWVAVPFPTEAAAQKAGMTLIEFEDLVFRAASLNCDDPIAACHALSEKQAHLIENLKRGKELRLRTPTGTDLRLAIADRTWVNGDGHENFPDGEVFTAPLEDATEGTICCDFPAFHAGGMVKGLRLVFRAGRVVEADAAEGKDFLHSLLAQDAGASVLGEIGLGCNYTLSRPTGLALLDEKMGGTCHVALGASFPATGGKNMSGLHWDLICDLRQGGEVQVDGRVISFNGRFLNPHFV